MDRLTLFESFLAVLDLGSFSAAARNRKISQPAMSQQMATLERLYDTPLLQRSTNGVRPTRAGELVAKHAQELLDAHRLLEAELSALESRPGGEFRISVNQYFAHSDIGRKITEIGHIHKDVEIILKVEDRFVDVVREGYDLALRTGALGETSGIARKIALLQTILVASPAYLDQMGRPQAPEDLVQLTYIQYREHRLNGILPLMHDGVEIEAPIVPGLIADTPHLLIDALQSGRGFSRIPKNLAADLIQDGTVEQVLPGYDAASKNMYLVYPHRHALNSTARLVISTICEAMKDRPDIDLLNVSGLAKAA